MAQRVEATGSKESKIAIVGEAPGYQEEKLGKPFVGKSGKLMVELMSRAQIQRSQCYITNVIKEKPYKNNVNPYINLSKKQPKISDSGQAYIDELKQELSECDANVIVAVGSTALFVLTGKRSITKWRGSILESTLLPGKKVVGVIHPSAALRMYIYRHFIAKDLQRVKAESRSPDINLMERELIIKPTFDQCIQYLNECKDLPQIGFDIEVGNLEVSCISFSKSKTSAISIPFTELNNHYFNPEQETIIWREIGKILENKNQKHIAQNAIFDVSFIYKKYGIVTENIHCTMVQQGILFPELPKGLDFLTSVYTDVPYYKDDGKFKNPNVKDYDYWVYNAKDSVVLHEIHDAHMAELRQLGNMETYLQQVALVQPLAYMMEHGIKIDVDKKREKLIEAKQKEAQLQEEINNIVGYEINPKSPKQLKQYFYKEKKYKPYVNNGKPTTNEKALKQLSAKGDRVAKLLLEYRKVQTASSRYFDMKLDVDNRIRCSFNPVGTETGRLSSRKTIFGTGGNMQNLPPEAKEYMVPDPDCIAYEVDCSQAENRIVAYLGPDKRMIDAFEQGKDIHSLTASMIFGGEPTKEVQNSMIASIGGGDKNQRYWGKQSNHAFNYDLGYVSFSRRQEIPQNEGKEIHRGYHRAYPGVKKFHLMVQEKLRANRTLSNLFGRKFFFMDRWGDSMFKQAYAFIPQSTVADVINRWGINYIWNNQDIFHALRLLNQVHDSIIFEIPNSLGYEEHARIIKALCKNMEQELTWNSRSFIIPASLTVMKTSFKDNEEIGQITQYTDSEIAHKIKAIVESEN